MANSEVRIVVQVGMVTMTPGKWDWRDLVAYRLRGDVPITDLLLELDRRGTVDSE